MTTFSTWKYQKESGDILKDESQNIFLTSTQMESRKKNEMLRRHRNNPFPSPPVSAAKQLQPTSCVIHQTLYKTSTYDHQIETGISSRDPADSLSRAFLVVTATIDEIVRGGENGKKREREKRENENERDNGNIVLSSCEWGNTVAWEYFSLLLVWKNNYPPPPKKGERKASEEWVGGRRGGS